VFPNPLLILEAVVGFGVLIFVHELGHFLAAKWIGVRVDAFSLGFGPSLKKKWGETEYRLGICPLGGYVKMAGEEPNPDKPPQPGEFYSKSVGQRAVVFGAGVFMNLVFGFIAFMLAYQFGVPTVPATVGGVEPGSTAWMMGLRRDDRIERIQGVSPPIDFEDLRTAIMLSSPGEGIRLTASRGGRTFERVLYPKYEKELGMPSAGIYQPTTMTVAAVSKSHGADEEGEVDFRRVLQAGLKPGDVITAVQVAGSNQATPVSTPQEFQNALDDSAGAAIRIRYQRGASFGETAAITPELVGEPHWLGIRFGSNRVSDVRPGSWAEKAGILPGDIIVSVADKPVRSRGEAANALDGTGAASSVSLAVRRGDKDARLTVPGPLEDKTETCIAFEPEMVVDSTMRGYPADRIELRPGDEIVSANGVEVKDARRLSEVLMAAKGEPVRLEWRRDGKLMEASVTPQKRWTIGVPFEMDQTVVRSGVPGSCLLGARKAYQWALRTYAALRSLIFGEVSTRHLSGPISIGYLAYAAAKRGLGMFLYILGVLNINLGVMNLLPVPVLDGGHLMFAVVEKVRGRPLSERIRSLATYMGLGLIIGLLLLAFWNDIRGLITG